MAKLGIVKFLHASHGKNVHEHNIKIEFTFEGDLEGDYVVGIDFHDVKERIETLLENLEEKYLPEVPEMGKGTMENLACYLIRKLDFDELESVTVWEAEDRYVKIYTDEV